MLYEQGLLGLFLQVSYVLVSIPQDCQDVKIQKGASFWAGVHSITPGYAATSVKCDADGWTVIQSRGMFGNPQDFFFKDWATYKAR
jgi:hypothetical protein